MTSGWVTDSLEAFVRVSILGSHRKCDMDALIDTGFDGFLTLPSEVIRDLGLPWIADELMTLADGSTESFDVYEAEVVWDGTPRTVKIHQSDGPPLLGMRLLKGFTLTMTVLEGGTVSITPAAPPSP